MNLADLKPGSGDLSLEDGVEVPKLNFSESGHFATSARKLRDRYRATLRWKRDFSLFRVLTINLVHRSAAERAEIRSRAIR